MPKVEIPIESGTISLSESGKKLASITLSFEIPSSLIDCVNETKIVDLKSGDIRKIIFSGNFEKSNNLEIFFLPPG